MVSELKDDVEIQGRVFLFRTRLMEETEVAIQATVRLREQVIARRRITFEGRGLRSPEVIRAWMAEQHKRLFEVFVSRLLRYQSRDRNSQPSSHPVTDPSLPVPADLPEVGLTSESLGGDKPGKGSEYFDAEPPSSTATPSLVAALRARRYFTGFGLLLGDLGPLTADGAAPRLKQALRALKWMTQSVLFNEIRIDEQVRCHLLRQDIEEWMSGTPTFVEGQRIWADLSIFMNYLLEINHRSELAAFDDQMLHWAFDYVRHGGMTDDVLEQLAWIYGLLPQLNRLLEDPSDVADGTWVQQLRNALMLTSPSAMDGDVRSTPS